MSQVPTLAVVDGEGIGPSIVSAALEVLTAATEVSGTTIAIDRMPSLTERDEYGLIVGASAQAEYNRVFASGFPVLHGPAGGRFVYQLRDQFDLSVKQTPIVPWAELADASIVDPRRTRDVDILVVRDNAGGLYQGDFGADGDSAVHSARYTEAQVSHVIRAAVQAAEQRNHRLTVVTKPGGVPTISRLWREVAEKTVPSTIELDFCEIDNACFQVLADPKRFDVIATPNMFGDVLGDTATALLGSRGMAYSVNRSESGRAVYQTAHGAAHDMTGKDVANPSAQILTLAWLVRDSLGLSKVADAMVAGLRAEIGRGVRTPDIAGENSMVVGTTRFTERVCDAIRAGDGT